MVKTLILSLAILQELIIGITTSPANVVTFTHIRGSAVGGNAAGTTLALTLTGAPATGNAVICGIWTGGGASQTATLADGNSNSYTQTSASPVGPNNVRVFGFYLLNAPSNASATITATFNSSTNFGSYMACDEFHRSGGTWAADSQGNATGTSSVANISTPTITVTGRDVIFAIGGTGARFTGVNGSWTQNASGLLTTGCGTNTPCGLGEYQMNVTANTTVGLTLSSSSQAFASIGMSFK